MGGLIISPSLRHNAIVIQLSKKTHTHTLCLYRNESGNIQYFHSINRPFIVPKPGPVRGAETVETGRLCSLFDDFPSFGRSGCRGPSGNVLPLCVEVVALKIRKKYTPTDLTTKPRCPDGSLFDIG